MDLSSPLRTLVPSLDSATLEALAGTESALSVTQIARLAGRGTRQGHQVVLDRLVDHGLVLATPGNRGQMYRLNRSHVLCEAVLLSCRARATVIDRITDTLRSLHPQPIHASVFGSFARREAGPASDIDLLLVLPDNSSVDEQLASQIDALAEQVHSWTGNRLQWVTVTKKQLRGLAKAREPIVDAWRRDTLLLHGAPIETVITASPSRKDGALDESSQTLHSTRRKTRSPR